jgi:uncharacterized damage-inducible protein DinB
MRTHLLETFAFNDKTNRKLLDKIRLMPDRTEAVKFFSHLINSQYKWMAHITGEPDAHKRDWWLPVYDFEQLEDEWDKSLKLWTDYIGALTDDELPNDIVFVGEDGVTLIASTPKDIALQLNYHSIHHRAQIQMMLRAQDVDPSFVDYIGTKTRRVSQ